MGSWKRDNKDDIERIEEWKRKERSIDLRMRVIEERVDELESKMVNIIDAMEAREKKEEERRREYEEERKTQAEIKEWAQVQRSKGKEIKIGFGKVRIEGQWRWWEDVIRGKGLYSQEKIMEEVMYMIYSFNVFITEFGGIEPRGYSSSLS
ncbi:hypothetical protein DMN91_004421 [Ooceraea biroi]|uniref:Uncharacterized protein n=1 Tax=Ooceraea biroi TaxID=2015173 RepID=A0A3L8DUZ6_OOCBI|nr:hypothetical protein DMN91_004421 [Ooceraea biroi]